MDGYMQWRSEQVAVGAACGRTLSVAWPLWAEGGMQVDAAGRERMWRSAGFAPLPTSAGVDALDQALALQAAQIVVLSGSSRRIAQTLLRDSYREDAGVALLAERGAGVVGGAGGVRTPGAGAVRMPGAAATAEQPNWLHPLVQRNTSDLREQRYTSWLRGDEFFLRHHPVSGHRVLSAAAQLELAREAVWRALGGCGADVQPELHNVVFARPVLVGAAGHELHIALQTVEDGAVEWEIYSATTDHRRGRHGNGGNGSAGRAADEDDYEGIVVHSQGRAMLRPVLS
jgi:hypothetical protein